MHRSTNVTAAVLFIQYAQIKIFRILNRKRLTWNAIFLSHWWFINKPNCACFGGRIRIIKRAKELFIVILFSIWIDCSELWALSLQIKHVQIGVRIHVNVYVLFGSRLFHLFVFLFKKHLEYLLLVEDECFTVGKCLQNFFQFVLLFEVFACRQFHLLILLY